MSRRSAPLYDDGKIRCSAHDVTIRNYYLWGSKRIPFASIRSVQQLPLTGLSAIRRWRLWGSGDFVHWWNLDVKRPGKRVALVLNVGGTVRPTITPDDPAAVERILRAHIGRR